RQHIRRPHKPDILEGFKDRFWSFAIFIETGSKSPKKVEQQSILPQGPIPPSIFASSRTPICLNSIRVLNKEAKSLTRYRKHTSQSAVKKKIFLLQSNVTSTSTRFMLNQFRIFFA